MRKIARITAMALAAGFVAAVLPAGAAHAATLKTNETVSSCIKTSSSDTYSTYATSRVETDRGATATTHLVKLQTKGIGKSFDCGPKGASYSVPTITVTVEWSATGSTLDCSASVEGGSGGSVSFTCASNRSTVKAVDSYTCKNVSSCTVSYTPIVFAAASGTIDKIVTKVTTAISGPSGQVSTTSSVNSFPFS